jgi:hypothetical protein
MKFWAKEKKRVVRLEKAKQNNLFSPSRSFFKNNNNNNKRNGNLRRVVPECRLTAR